MSQFISEVKYDDIKTVPDSYKPIIYSYNSNDKKIYDVDPEVSVSNPYPLLSLGFQHFIHQNVIKMEIIKEFKNRKKIYSTMHTFGVTIDDYDTDIRNITIEYFKLDKTNKILGSGFYKMWEIITSMKLIPTTSPCKTVHLAETDGSNAQSVMMYRETFSHKTTNKDTHYIIHSPLKATKKINDNFIRNNGNKIVLQTIPKQDLINQSSIKSITKFVGSKVNFVTAYGAPEWKYTFALEPEHIKIFVWEIACALNILENGGHFVCRIFETFTNVMCKLIYILSQLFGELFIIKPLTSHVSSSEKFIVCKNFKHNTKIHAHFDELLSRITENENIVNVYPDLVLPNDFYALMLACNTEIANKQIICINKIVSFIKSQNYFGDMYVDGRNAQIAASKYWINVYYPNNGEYSNMIKLLDTISDSVIDKSNKNINEKLKLL